MNAAQLYDCVACAFFLQVSKAFFCDVQTHLFFSALFCDIPRFVVKLFRTGITSPIASSQPLSINPLPFDFSLKEKGQGLKPHPFAC